MATTDQQPLLPQPPPPKDPKEAKDEAQAAHYALLEELDIHSIHKSFRSSTWKPNQRRNKNIKTILGDASRKEASASSAVATPMEGASGAATPTANNNNNHASSVAATTTTDQQNDDGLSTSGTSTPANDGSVSVAVSAAGATPNLAQASRSLSKLVLEKSLRSANGAGQTLGGLAAGGAGAPSATYTNIEGAPSLAPQRRYCDVTGLKANYSDPKTRLRYHNAEVFGLIRALPQGYAEQYLEARGAHTVLK
ncbi:hypothetical protein BD289DRAFT_423514 [Coniella lustricola]|uniref:Vps72/YL1 C-terminal domain-containing protein n=1 Tax=Coniella lustricola TaxID=2025994 RepID=A0A2T3AJ72_9PEZI|nr:hypothetical protein BD289DRAFT_423514 [Coniella lustricola]